MRNVWQLIWQMKQLSHKEKYKRISKFSILFIKNVNNVFHFKSTSDLQGWRNKLIEISSSLLVLINLLDISWG